MKSLSLFPKASQVGFDRNSYGIDVRRQVGAESPYAGEVGLELELEGLDLPHRFGGRSINGCTWVHHSDGSLRAVGGQAPGGSEYVLNQPCNRADVKPLVDSLFANIKAAGGRVQNSTRCSTHVHLNMAGAKLNQIASFVALWSTFEDVLANWCGSHRSGNHFALRLSDCHGAVEAWSKAFRTGVFEFSRERRYLALNPACLATFGSLEVRTLAGVEDSADVVRWVDWLMRLRDMAFSAEFENPQAIAGAFSGDGALGFAERVFGADDVAILRASTEELDEDFLALIVEGFRRIQPIVYGLPWDAVLPDIKRPYVPDPFGKAVPMRARRPLARPLREDDEDGDDE